MLAIISSWRSIDLTEISKISDLTGIVLLSHKEWQYTSLLHGRELFEDLLDISMKKNVTLHIVHGSSGNNPCLFDKNDIKLQNVELYPWETYWITDTYYKVISDTYLSNIIKEYFEFDPIDDILPFQKEYQYLFLSLNNKPHHHRCVFIDLIAKYDLLKKTALTWHEDRYDNEKNVDVEFISDYRGFRFQYWKLKKSKLTELVNNIEFNQNLMPLEYKHSFLHLVVESNSDHIFLTEKTAMPLLMGKPFLIFSSSKYYDFLDRLGFLRYDEFIDYDFDSIDDLSLRYERQLSNLITLSKKGNDDLQHYNLLIENKLKFNKKLFNLIAKDRSKIPNIVLELYENQSEDLKRIDYDLYLCVNYVLNIDNNTPI